MSRSFEKRVTARQDQVPHRAVAKFRARPGSVARLYVCVCVEQAIYIGPSERIEEVKE